MDRPEVTTPILKFISEFAYNKSSRIAFNVSSANGYLLFRLLSQVVVAYGNRAVHFPKTGYQYRLRFKGTWICFVASSRSLIGSYVNFGVFQLYGDPAWSNMVEIIFKMMSVLSPKGIVEYKKLGMAYFSLVDMLLNHHMELVAKLDFRGFHGMLSTVEAGLKSFDTQFSSMCAAAIDKLATCYYTYAFSITGRGSCSVATSSNRRDW